MCFKKKVKYVYKIFCTNAIHGYVSEEIKSRNKAMIRIAELEKESPNSIFYVHAFKKCASKKVDK